ncbi:hypothetical protein AB1A81_08735 [Bdellovibrio bacteriovorus]|uniref:Uncharacterized protein n=1 Tax=Bdellovibrio bacteriovorus (strain ATCC 15356 / DSM 50701 / NCIMB 9529 / HD100) TaxID=264462 RepID=Q6MLT9_BDEBA|nr:hypothetical protein [Bdellovibrio bacteriovorus]BEV68303.1 hypothetical protein Bb109J_c1723 [Bdellovibrio bacteriovorus]CAE79767.1 hypothetical protein predicted by Glimmer/Critica [Bdellovibrio bacteriovorus HD100]
MLLQLTPSNWFFIFLALLLCSWVKLSSGKPQSPIQFASATIISAIR